MSNSNDNRLSFRPYRLAVERVQTQFNLIRFALRLLGEEDQKQFFEDVSDKKIAGMEQFRIRAKEMNQLQPKEEKTVLSDEEIDQIANDGIERIKSEMRRERRVGNLLATSEFSEDRLNQSELLLLVAHFESFMKLVHECFLLAAPAKVFGNGFRGEQNPRIPLKDIFDPTQSFWNSQKFLREQITKEVKWLDAQNIETKAEYFAKHFGIAFGKAEEIEELKEIMRRRNEISHEIYEPPKSEDEILKETLEGGKEQPIVLDPMLKKARTLFFSIPRNCIEYGGKTYQSYFKTY